MGDAVGAHEPYPAKFRDMETVVFDLNASSSSSSSNQRATQYFEDQTENVETEENDTNTPVPASSSAQTVEEGTQGASVAPEPSSDDASWRSFLDNAVPMMEEALAEKVENRVFDDYIYVAQDDENEMKCTHDLPFPQKLADAIKSRTNGEGPAVLPCTAVAWNSTGSILAATYGRTDLKGWDAGQGGVCAWSMYGRHFDAENPDMVFDVKGCFMSIAFHPKKPAVCAVGSFTGEVYILNVTNKDDNLIGRSKIDDYFHREPITDLSWVFDYDERDYQISSISGDGKILFWSIKNRLQSPIRGYMLAPKRGSAGAKAKGRGSHAAIGGVSIAFTAGLVSTSFVTGSEGGQLHRCFLKTRGNKPLGENLPGSQTIRLKKDARQFLARVHPSSQAKVVRHLTKYCTPRGYKDLSARLVFKSKPPPTDVFQPATDMAFDPHVGPVYGLDCSPFNHNVFASCSADGQVRISNMLQTHPILTIDVGNHYLFDVKWSKVRPMVLAVASADGSLYVYDLNENIGSPVCKLKGGEVGVGPSLGNSLGSPKARPKLSNEPIQLQSVAFNPRLRNTVAFSDNHGNVKVWKLTWKLSNMKPGEERRLGLLADIANVRDFF
eukprot:INCI1843.2.p1 GENE.INCI1843.2~~INCI1843.2.p1  ORF type:complete len:689 (-),score=131.47 INCI1843.2:236-2062(-)